MKFRVEQIAIAPPRSSAAIELLTAMGAADWSKDRVTACGEVFGNASKNVANLAFNYQIGSEPIYVGQSSLEFEVLDYIDGENWMQSHGPSASHIGMHCTAEELVEWKAFFAGRNIGIAQEVNTTQHTNPVIAGKRFYTYCVFDTRDILGIDVKLIVRRNV